MIHEHSAKGLRLLDLPQSLAGYDRFISCWVYQRHKHTVLVDPGPVYSAGVLVEQLRGAGIDHVDLVLLTHIHLDHGGGTGLVLDAFPSARWYCHPKGVRHLTKPGLLWKGSLGVLGEVAKAYGEPAALPPERLADAETLGELGIRAIPTPGHAAHHVSFLAEEILFAGEAIATRVELGDEKLYMRPATPARFFPDVFFKSLGSLAALDPEPAVCAFAHYGATEGVRAWCDLAREQLMIWLDLVRASVDAHNEDVDDILLRLVKEDKLFSGLSYLDEQVQEREKFYARNSIKGLLQSVREERS